MIVVQHMIFQYQLTCRAGTNQLVTLTKSDHTYENDYDLLIFHHKCLPSTQIYRSLTHRLGVDLSSPRFASLPVRVRSSLTVSSCGSFSEKVIETQSC